MPRPIEEVRAREADPQLVSRANKVGAAIQKAINTGEMVFQLQSAQAAPTSARKIFHIYKATDEIGKAAKGKVPCDKGCSHCCYQPVLITDAEAEVISQFSGRKMVSPKSRGSRTNEYIGEPCNFLVEGKCSIYDVRPYACRTYFSVDIDDLLCEVRPGERVDMLAYDTRNVFEIFMGIIGIAAILNTADIRDFFAPK